MIYPDAAIKIDSGRKGFAITGKEREGRINYEDGIALAMEAFQEAQASADPETIILAEYTFLTQELEFCEKSDKDSLSSLSKAIRTSKVKIGNVFENKKEVATRRFSNYPLPYTSLRN